MALADIVVASKDIVVGKESFTVTGLSLEGIVVMLADYKSEITDLFEGTRDIVDIVKESPKFVATLIATASGEPDSVEAAMKLPIGVQLSAAVAIWEMSSIDPDEVGNLLGSVMLLLQKFNQKTPELIKVSSTGSKT